MVKQFEKLSDSQWKVIKNLFSEQVYCDLDLREVLNGIFWILRTGSQWRNLPSDFPNWSSVYYHFAKWKKNGRIKMINKRLNRLERKRKNRKPKASLVCVDSQSVKISSLIKEDKGFDGHKKINGRKRHIITDTMGLIIGVMVTAANSHDGTIGIELFGEVKDSLTRTKKVLADGSYKGSFEEFIKEFIKAEVEISSRPPSQKGFVPIKFRWVAERTFGWFNFFRRLDKEYEKKAETSAAFILLANCAVILNRIK